MSNIIKLTENDSDLIRLTRKSLLDLRDYYPNFGEWFDGKIANSLGSGRSIFLATSNGIFSGALILKNGEEKKICTLFVNPGNRHKNIGLDFLRIASDELETYKMPITFNESVKGFFLDNEYFNFYTKKIVNSKYKLDSNEYSGY